MKLTPRTKTHLLIAGGVIGGALLLVGGIALLSGPSKPTVSSAADIDRVVDHALKMESNAAVLRTFAAKLRAAGRSTQANLLEARANVFGLIQEVAIRTGPDRQLSLQQALQGG